MNPLTVTIIRDEHRALAAMLRSIPMLLDEYRRQRSHPDFEALRAMLFYVDEFPERLHHPKETQLLFPKLRARAPQLRETLNELDLDHARGEQAIRELQHSLLAYEMLGEPRRERFERQLQVYIDNYLRHMAREETEVLPVAQQALKAPHWLAPEEDLAAAFGNNGAPLPGHPADEVYQRLFSRLVNTLPAPVGLGEAR